MKPLVLLLLCLLFSTASTAFRQQSIGVYGRIMCDGRYYQGAEIKLWDKKLLGRDVELAVATTQPNGFFNVSGGTSSLLKMDVHLKIYHNCENKYGLCRRKVDLEVPSTYVTRTSQVERWFDAGTLNMAFKYPDESTECFG
ncbi:unnamed protein product, partial [Mesorhabditis spiculigera]